MSKQLTFDLPARAALGRGDFFVSEANALALARLDDWPNWPNSKLLLIGPTAAGKSHLAQVWAHETGALIMPASNLSGIRENLSDSGLVVEGADEIGGNSASEEALFHLFNLTRDRRIPVLFTASNPVRNWGLLLPDLQSRMQGIDQATLSKPDDALLIAVLVKLFSDRQLAVKPEVIGYIAKRMERSFAALQVLVGELDQRALSENRAVTRALAAEVLDKLSQTKA